ncbi:hypothetical protein [Rheinheimera maricola]|uniref:Uncharacterized protein n=1 Tax=Rheinheimera maricola TaxID=2793282 RepID=A0ABS7X5Q9_9GAMM|nr:hypothetical protein [Rheinheimera maricola]MBZ9610514.1 hypothetical protein [Rheinheimera maricola]
MSNRQSQLQHRLLETVKRELGPEYIRLFAPHFLSHGMPAGITGMMLSVAAALYIFYCSANIIGLADVVNVVEHYFFILIPVAAFVVLAYTFPFQNMVLGKKDHLLYFKKFALVCTLITILGVFFLEIPTYSGQMPEKIFLALPVVIGSVFCLLVYSKKFSAMLAYQQKLWVIKQRLIAEEKALVAELKRKTKNRSGI